ncbi:unnamed protein product [Aureobasidium vineae]|uniref:Uncharacterized protein n=1 Tax=Aureobasidium vineae TaxID=2773715 RepID=A0A9N8JZ47_9PEZI|nr:unnamed protein product [Aureobasidium vineae]
MPPTLRDLINSGKIGDRCLLRIDHCYQKANDRDFEVARNILGSAEFRDIHGDQDDDYDIDLRTLARCKYAKKIKEMERETDGFQSEITDLKQELEDGRKHYQQLEHQHAQMVDYANTEYGKAIAEGHAKSAELKDERRRHECLKLQHAQMNEYASKKNAYLQQEIKDEKERHEQLKHHHRAEINDRQTEYAKVIAQGNAKSAELEEERRQHEQLKHQHMQTIEYGEAKYAEMFHEAEAKFAELMQKITGLESQNLWLQGQMQNQRSLDYRDMAMMAATIKELNAGIQYCRGQQCQI